MTLARTVSQEKGESQLLHLRNGTMHLLTSGLEYRSHEIMGKL